jgi:isohexenylglutaconyl-CoA hydratase
MVRLAVAVTVAVAVAVTRPARRVVESVMPAAEFETLRLHADGGVLHVTLDRPQVRNAMNAAMVAELVRVADLVDAMAAGGSARALVLRGAGGHFCAGGDLKEVLAGAGETGTGAGATADAVAAISRSFGGMLRRFAQLPTVVIAVCEGSVLGGGFGLACVSDIALARRDARFGLPETRRGVPPAQIAPFAVQRIGLTQARRLCLTGADLGATQALALGLVHEVFDDAPSLDAGLAATLAQVLRCAPQANAITKTILLEVGDRDMDALLDDAAQRFADAVRSDEGREGLAAFVQKRAPRWAGPEVPS